MFYSYSSTCRLWKDLTDATPMKHRTRKIVSQQLVKKVQIVSWCLFFLLFFLEPAWQAEMWCVSSCCERSAGLPLQHLTVRKKIVRYWKRSHTYGIPCINLHIQEKHKQEEDHVVLKAYKIITSFIDHHGKVLFPGRLKDGISCTTAPGGNTSAGQMCANAAAEPRFIWWLPNCCPAKCMHVNHYAYNNPCPLVPHQLWLMLSSISLPIKVSLPLLEISVSCNSRAGRLLWSWLVLLLDIFLNDCNVCHVSVGTYTGGKSEYTNNEIIIFGWLWVLFVQCLSFNGVTILLSSAHSI